MSLLQEFVMANANLHRPGGVEWAVRHGVPRRVIYRPGGAAAGLARIGGSPLFQFDTGGTPAIILAVTGLSEPTEYEESLDTIYDLVAWLPAQPDEWFLRQGVAAILNPEIVEKSWMLDQPLIVNSNPLKWLQSNMEGVSILDWTACLSLHLGGVRRIVCDSNETASKITNKLNEERYWPMPDIRIRQEARHAA